MQLYSVSPVMTHRQTHYSPHPHINAARPKNVTFGVHVHSTLHKLIIEIKFFIMQIGLQNLVFHKPSKL